MCSLSMNKSNGHVSSIANAEMPLQEHLHDQHEGSERSPVLQGESALLSLRYLTSPAPELVHALLNLI